MGNARQRSVLVLWCTFVMFVGASAARADDAPSAPPAGGDEALAKVVEWEARIVQHQTAKDTEALAQDAKDGVSLHAAAPEKDPLRARVVKGIGALTKNRSKEVANAAIDALGETKDHGAAAYVRPLLRPVDDGEMPALTRAAVKAAGQIAADSLVEPLLSMMDESKNYDAAAKALEALGGFRECKRKREKILEEAVKSVLRDKPGGQRQGPRGGGENSSHETPDSGGQTGNGPASRWGALTPVLVTSMNSLTGRTLTSPDEWFNQVRSHKNNLGELFDS